MRKKKQPDYVQPDLQPEDLAKNLYTARPKKKRASAHHGPMKILRSERYKGHDVRIETTYRMTIDGAPIRGHLDVTNSGQVHYHPLPNRSTSSAIEMARAIIDSFPDDFPSPKKGGRTGTTRRKKASSRKTTTRKAAGKTSKKTGSDGTRRKGRR